jgi:hypothetical protein
MKRKPAAPTKKLENFSPYNAQTTSRGRSLQPTKNYHARRKGDNLNHFELSDIR